MPEVLSGVAISMEVAMVVLMVAIVLLALAAVAVVATARPTVRFGNGRLRRRG